jgi:protein JSN1
MRLPHTAVRIGFGKFYGRPPYKSVNRLDELVFSGKADSAPVTPASAFGYSRVTASAEAAGAGIGQLQTTPTRALWIGSIPATTTSNDLLNVFGPFGPIESARVLTHKNCGFVNMERIDDAVRARKVLNGRELFGSQVGVIKSKRG